MELPRVRVLFALQRIFLYFVLFFDFESVISLRLPQSHGGGVVQMTQDLQDKDESLRFLAIGDWGGLPYSPFFTMIERTIASKMSDLVQKDGYQFVVGLGDNFYFDGVNSSHDPRFKETFEDIFTDDSLQIPWYMMAGNHDHRANVTAQIAYSELSKRWKFPDYNYTFTLPVSGSHSARFVMLDTMILCGISDRDYLGQPPLGPEDTAWARRTLRWLEEVLRNSRDEYLFVCGHYPVYSIGYHGPTRCLLETVEPLLHKYNVTAYLNGHDHSLQHIQYSDEHHHTNVDYFTVGAANFISTSTAHRHAVPHHSLKFHWANMMAFGGLAGVKLTAERATFTFYQANGTALYEHHLKPRMIT